MRLFPTVHATGDLPPAHRAHLERHGLVLVGADDDPDLVLVLPGTAPAGAVAGHRRRRARDRVRDARGRPAARLPRASRRAPSPRRPSGLVPADLTADDLLAWTTDAALPVRATLDVDGPAVPLLRTATGSQALGRTVGAGLRDAHGRLLVLGVDALDAPGGPAQRGDLGGPPGRGRLADDRHDARWSTHPAWTRLKRDVTELQGLQVKDGSVPDDAAAPPRPRAGARDRPVRRRARARAPARRGVPRRPSART